MTGEVSALMLVDCGPDHLEMGHSERRVPFGEAVGLNVAAAAQKVLERRVPCLCGASVNPESFEELISCPHGDGLFIGRSAWDITGYLNMLDRCTATLDLGETT